MELTRFEVFAPDAQLIVHTDAGEIREPMPGHRYFKGQIAGEPNSYAFLSVREQGGVRGLVTRGGRYWVLDDGGDAQRRGQSLGYREVSGDEILAGNENGYACGTDDIAVPADKRNAGPDHEVPGNQPSLGKRGGAYFATIAVETDYEYFQMFGNRQDALDYIGDIFGYLSGIYERDVNTALVVGDVSIWETSSDPWSATSTSCGLYEFGKYWNDNHSGTTRTIAHFMSGKRSGGGIAWVGVLCRGGFNYPKGSCSISGNATDNYGGAYGLSGSLNGNFNIDNPQVLWDTVVVAHEIGHNFNSPHTHCYGGIGGNSEPIDKCYGSQSGCYSGAASLPCGQTGAGCGTIMSYCHLLSGGIRNIAMNFGVNHAHGVEPQRVASRMSDHVVSRASSNPSCLPQACDLPSISVHPLQQAACEGGNRTLTVTASGSGLSYQWYKDGQPIANATSASLSLPNLQVSQSGNYSCTVSNGCGSVQSNSGFLTVYQSVSIATQPVSQNSCTGQNVTLSVDADGSGLTYQWRKNGQVMAGQTSANLHLSNLTLADAGNYDCLVTGHCNAVTTSAVSLSVGEGVAITSHPQGTQVCTDASISFSVAATGSSLSYQWRRNGQNIQGANTATLNLTNVQPGDLGSYSCVVSNSCNEVTSSSAFLTVLDRPLITGQPEGQTICQWQDVTLSATVNETGFTYQWRKNGQNIPGATSRILELNRVEPEDAGAYDLVVSSESCGSATSSVAVVLVRDLPRFTLEPQSSSQCLGDVVTLRADATSSEEIVYMWRFNGNDLPNTNSNTLSVNLDSPDKAGRYECTARNACGLIRSREVTLTLDGELGVTLSPPVIAQGLLPITLRSNISCFSDSLNVTWYNMNDGSVLGTGNTDYAFSGRLAETTLVEIEVEQPSAGSTVSDQALVLVSENSAFDDLDGDGCNTMADLWMLAEEWRNTYVGDPNGDGFIDVLDYQYINTDDSYPCDN
ncbi:immunoglobulin domain-containing protein [Sulfidibacter corallicola]|uniref:Immunoglobulin domain-containing protein n=1 Tax=Sulfidibacter corallicola TaxID=2818388 RepID=A0A8A4TR50_SULCO|nr:immunoglobulin domain-containing protein [Sulfidibacter corallicola]QTD51664.1 immunoglobulin domain-containing protein [Sulfidibacter corallicola]